MSRPVLFSTRAHRARRAAALAVVGSAAALAAIFASPAIAQAQSFVVEPFLQLVDPDGAWVVWETDAESPSVVQWGAGDLGADLEESSTGSAVPGRGDSRVHSVHLEGLEANTRYAYSVDVAGEVRGGTFVTPPPVGAAADFRIVAMSDMQRDGSQPDKFRELIEDGVLAWATSIGAPGPSDALAFAIFPGDLVDAGNTYDQWADHFFRPARALLRDVPLYPALGNHEANTANYFRYFILPDNETPGWEEHWWTHDYANLRMIGLDSNEIATILPLQLEWLEATLADTCDDPSIDFVFAELHHPYHSELWPDGNSGFTGRVIEELEQFSTDCGKPSVHFYGHTHAYARGQSQNHNHLMVNVASAGGGLDRWGQGGQIDYPETTVSQDTYGFVVVDVHGGADARFSVSRYSRGTPEAPQDNVLSDFVTVRLHETPPAAPALVGPVGNGVAAECATLAMELPVDPDGDPIQAVEWQVAARCDGFDDPLIDRWVQGQNWWNGRDENAGIDLSRELIELLPPDSLLCWRARARDIGLAWSDWSTPVLFQTAPSLLGDELLDNPGAESISGGWTTAVSSVIEGTCGSGDSVSGRRIFVVGGDCADPDELVGVSDEIDLAGLDGSRLRLSASAAATARGEVEARLVFTAADGSDVGAQVIVSNDQTRWQTEVVWVDVPTDAVSAHVELAIISGALGYFDALSIRTADATPDCQAAGDGELLVEPAEDVGTPDAGGDADAADSGTPDGGADDATSDADIEAADSSDDADADQQDATEDAAGSGRTHKSGCAAAPSSTSQLGFLLVAAAALARRRRGRP